MKKLSLALLTSTALCAGVSAAEAAACATAAVSVYTTPGFSCTIDSLTFSNFVVSTLGSVTLGNFAPFQNLAGTEFGLTLNYQSAASGSGAGSDVDWTYNVAGIPPALISDAFASFVGTVSGTGTASLAEQFQDAHGNTVGSISLTAPNTSDTVFFNPAQPGLSVVKDQQNFSGTSGSALTSSLTNAFSTTAVPGPIVGAGLPGLVALFGGGGLFFRRRVKDAMKALRFA